MSSAPTPQFTARLRLEPIAPHHAAELWRLHRDEGIAQWYGGVWSRQEAAARANGYHRAWRSDGVSKWIAFDRVTDELIGRGGLSRTEVAGELRWELGWAVRLPLWGRGYATEIGRAGLRFGFEELGADEVVAYTERHNRRSRAVAERLGMRFLGEIRAPGLVAGLPGIHDDAPFALYGIDAETHELAQSSQRREDRGTP